MHEDRDDHGTDFLSDAWLAAMARSATSTGSGAAAADGGVGSGDELVVQQVVGDPAAGAVAWFVVLDGSQVRFGVGRHPCPAITFTQDRPTAAAIGSGRQSAQAAFMGGQLRVGGDVRILLDRQEDLARLDDVFATVRAATRFPEVDTADRPQGGAERDAPSHA